jgi:hypothetical protein
MLRHGEWKLVEAARQKPRQSYHPPTHHNPDRLFPFTLSIQSVDTERGKGSSNNKRKYNDVNVSHTEIYHSTFTFLPFASSFFVYVHRNYGERASCSTHIFIYFMPFSLRQEISALAPSSHISFMSNRFECYT